jgi:hypothetical protein
MAEIIYGAGARLGMNDVLSRGNVAEPSRTVDEAPAVSRPGAVPQPHVHAAQYSAAQNGGGNPDTLFDHQGAPALDMPLGPFDISGLVAMMVAMTRETFQKFTEARLSVAMMDIYKNTKLRVDNYVAAQREKIADFKKKCDELADQGTVSKIFGWFSKHLGTVLPGLVLAAVAVITVCTGGATIGLLALAAVAFAGSVLSSAGVSLSTVICDAVTKAFSVFLPKETAEKLGNLVGGALMVVTLAFIADPSGVGKMWRGAAELMGADKQTAEMVQMVGTIVGVAAVAAITVLATGGAGTVSAISSVAGQTAATTAQWVITGSSLLSAGVGIGQGGFNINLAVERYGVETADAAQKLIQKVVKMVREDLTQVQAEIQGILDNVLGNCKENAEMIARYVGFLTDRAATPIAA